MKLDRTRRLLDSEPDTTDPQRLLVDVLAATVELLSLEENDFAWSPWGTQAAALQQVRPLLELAESGVLPEHADLWVLFAPTGPVQEVSLNSGWPEAFIKLAERFDAAEDLLWPPDSPNSR